MQGQLASGLNGMLGIRLVQGDADFVRMDMPVTTACLQPFGYVHGGATLALLEAAASLGAELRCNLECERPFGSHMDVRHVRSCREGTVHATASLASEENLGERGSRQVWDVHATDDAGDLLSAGTFVTRIVSFDYLAAKESASM